jgi:streptomycin 6-kinase
VTLPTHPAEVRRRVDDLICEWRVTVDRVTDTGTSLMAFGHRDGRAVVLKAIKSGGNEWRSGELLNAFAQQGVVHAHEHNGGAVLLEQLRPGNSVMEMSIRGEDERATTILAHTIAAMSARACPDWVPTVADWGESFGNYLASQDTQLRTELVAAAADVYSELCASQMNVRLLHGDLHHENVLFDQDRGWLAIDPKGVRGELAYEIGAALRNPSERPDLFAQPQVIRMRVDRFARTLDVDATRVLRWAFAQAVLAAIWEIEDGIPVGPGNRWLAFARAIGSLVAERVDI